MNNLKDIHNLDIHLYHFTIVVLSGFQWTIWRIYTTPLSFWRTILALFYQDFNEQFEGYTQPKRDERADHQVVLSGFQWTIWRIYTTRKKITFYPILLFYQDFNEQFEGYTQHSVIHHLLVRVVLSGFQWTIWRIYTTPSALLSNSNLLFYQDFNEQFEGYTQQCTCGFVSSGSCFIRISMNNLKDIHNVGLCM